MFPAKQEDEFVGVIATKTKEGLTLLAYNYIDPEIVTSYLSKNIASLNSSERKILLNIIKSDKLEKIIARQLDIAKLRATNKVKALLKRALELHDVAQKFKNQARNLKLGIKNLKENYLYQRFVIDSSCGLNCHFKPVEEKEINAADLYQEILSLNPYSVQLVVLQKKPQEQPAVPESKPQEETSSTPNQKE